MLDNKPAKTVDEIRERILFQVHTADIDWAKLCEKVTSLIAGLRRVNTENSNALALIAQKAYDNEMKNYPDIKTSNMIKICIWIGDIQMGWF